MSSSKTQKIIKINPDLFTLNKTKKNVGKQKKVKPILEELSQELGVTVILEKNSVLLSATNMDITGDVIKRLNKELPKIKVSLD